jgi:MSHA biogenesis protein MshJ
VKAKLKLWMDRIDAMSLRERAMIFAMLAVAVIALGFSLAIDPLSARKKTLDQQRVQQQAQIAALQAQMQVMIDAIKNDPDAPNRARLAAVQRQVTATRAELAGVQQGFVAPHEMAQLLRDMLGKNPHLKLVSVKSVAPSAVTGAPAGDGKTTPAKADDKPQGDAPQLYKHGIEITIEGGYGDLVAYLGDLERMPWRVYWGGAKLAVD